MLIPLTGLRLPFRKSATPWTRLTACRILNLPRYSPEASSSEDSRPVLRRKAGNTPQPWITTTPEKPATPQMCGSTSVCSPSLLDCLNGANAFAMWTPMQAPVSFDRTKQANGARASGGLHQSQRCCPTATMSETRRSGFGRAPPIRAPGDGCFPWLAPGSEQ